MSSEHYSDNYSSSSPSQVPAGTLARLRDQVVEAGFRPRPLQDETAMFILVNVLDIYITYMLLAVGGSEANPVARFFLDRWGFDGMIFFKMMIIAFYCVVTLVIAGHHLERAKSLLRFGTVVVAVVVIYGSCLMMLLEGQKIFNLVL